MNKRSYLHPRQQQTHRRYSSWLLVFGLCAFSLVAPIRAQEGSVRDYRIDAIRYATFPDFRTSIFIGTASEDERIDAAGIIWLIRGNNKTILFDTGFHRETYLETYKVSEFMRPDQAVALAGVAPDAITDIIVSHAHWDHMGGIDLFPSATIWIQEAEFSYYTSAAWQPGGKNGGIDAEDVVNLVRKNTEGKVRLVSGDSVEIMPGVTVYTGARHTYASQYIRVDGDPHYVLASDNCYLYRNLEEGEPVAITFEDSDRDANKAALERMVQLAGSADRVVPGHDPKLFDKFSTAGRIARIK